MQLQGKKPQMISVNLMFQATEHEILFNKILVSPTKDIAFVCDNTIMMRFKFNSELQERYTVEVLIALVLHTLALSVHIKTSQRPNTLTILADKNHKHTVKYFTTHKISTKRPLLKKGNYVHLGYFRPITEGSTFIQEGHYNREYNLDEKGVVIRVRDGFKDTKKEYVLPHPQTLQADTTSTKTKRTPVTALLQSMADFLAIHCRDFKYHKRIMQEIAETKGIKIDSTPVPLMETMSEETCQSNTIKFVKETIQEKTLTEKQQNKNEHDLEVFTIGEEPRNTQKSIIQFIVKGYTEEYGEAVVPENVNCLSLEALLQTTQGTLSLDKIEDLMGYIYTDDFEV